jgi:hypothetical protein
LFLPTSNGDRALGLGTNNQCGVTECKSLVIDRGFECQLEFVITRWLGSKMFEQRMMWTKLSLRKAPTLTSRDGMVRFNQRSDRPV